MGLLSFMGSIRANGPQRRQDAPQTTREVGTGLTRSPAPFGGPEVSQGAARADLTRGRNGRIIGPVNRTTPQTAALTAQPVEVCPDCDSPLSIHIGKVTCSECKTSYLVSINPDTDNFNIKPIVEARSHNGMDKTIGSRGITIRNDIVVEDDSNILKCDFCHTPVDISTSYKGRYLMGWSKRVSNKQIDIPTFGISGVFPVEGGIPNYKDGRACAECKGKLDTILPESVGRANEMPESEPMYLKEGSKEALTNRESIYKQSAEARYRLTVATFKAMGWDSSMIVPPSNKVKPEVKPIEARKRRVSKGNTRRNKW